MSTLLISYVLRAAVRDRIVISLLVGLVAGTCMAIFLGSSAVIEGAQSGAVFIGAALRVVGILGLVLFVVFVGMGGLMLYRSRARDDASDDARADSRRSPVGGSNRQGSAIAPRGVAHRKLAKVVHGRSPVSR